jgi:hypothetical protein
VRALRAAARRVRAGASPLRDGGVCLPHRFVPLARPAWPGRTSLADALRAAAAPARQRMRLRRRCAVAEGATPVTVPVAHLASRNYDSDVVRRAAGGARRREPPSEFLTAAPPLLTPPFESPSRLRQQWSRCRAADPFKFEACAAELWGPAEAPGPALRMASNRILWLVRARARQFD